MKAIIIQDQDARALLDQLKLETMPTSMPVFISGAKPEEVDEFNQRYAVWIKQTREDCYRRFHYVACRWLQEHGASLSR